MAGEQSQEEEEGEEEEKAAQTLSKKEKRKQKKLGTDVLDEEVKEEKAPVVEEEEKTPVAEEEEKTVEVKEDKAKEVVKVKEEGEADVNENDDDDDDDVAGPSSNTTTATSTTSSAPRLTNKQRRKLKEDREREDREAAMLKASQDGAQFSVTQQLSSAANENLDTSIVRIENFSISAGGRELFVNASLTIVQGRRYGLVGPNGKGKTTLLKQLANRSLAIPSNLDCLLVEQEFAATDMSVIEAVLAADAKRASLLAEEKELTQLMEKSPERITGDMDDRLQAIYEELALIGAESAEPRARYTFNPIACRDREN